MQQQIIQMAHPHPSSKEALRYEVDAKRMGVSENSDDALPRCASLKRLTAPTMWAGCTKALTNTITQRLFRIQECVYTLRARINLLEREL